MFDFLCLGLLFSALARRVCGWTVGKSSLDVVPWDWPRCGQQRVSTLRRIGETCCERRLRRVGEGAWIALCVDLDFRLQMDAK